MVNGKYFTIDAHCHIYPEKIAAPAINSTDNFYDTVSYGKGTVEDLLYQNSLSGVDKCIVQSVATTPKQVRSINNFIAKEVEAHKETLIGFGTMHPESEDLKGDIEHLVSLGLKGVKLHPDIQRFKLDDYRCLKIYELCEANDLVLLVHAGDSRYDNSNPNRLRPIAEIYDKLKIIAAHLGGWSVWREAYKQLSDLGNIYVDCSSSFYYIKPNEAKEVIRAYGADKVLFGTDYPMWCPKSELDIFLSLGLTDEENRKILGENAKKLLHLE